MTINHAGSIDSSYLERTAKVCSRLQLLPGVPTTTWCDAAAAALAPILGDGCIACRVSFLDYRNGDTRPRIGMTGAFPSGALHGDEANGGGPLHTLAGLSADRGNIVPPGRATAAWTEDSRSAPPGGNVATQLGAGWERQGVSRLLVGMVGIETGERAEPSGGTRVLLVELGAGSDHNGDDRAEVGVLSALLPELARRARTAFGPGPAGKPLQPITSREQDVLELLARGRSVKQIASALSRSPHTVHDHIKAIHRKVGASSRGELIARAIGWTDTPSLTPEPV